MTNNTADTGNSEQLISPEQLIKDLKRIENASISLSGFCLQLGADLKGLRRLQDLLKNSFNSSIPVALKKDQIEIDKSNIITVWPQLVGEDIVLDGNIPMKNIKTLSLTSFYSSEDDDLIVNPEGNVTVDLYDVRIFFSRFAGEIKTKVLEITGVTTDHDISMEDLNR